MTFAEIQTEVERRLIDLPQAVQDAIPSLVNQAIRDMQDTHNYKAMEATQESNTVLDTRVLVAKPALWKEARGRPWYEENTGTVTLMEYSPDTNSALMQYNDDGVGGEPALLVLTPANIEVYPKSDGNSDFGDGEYRVRVPYWAYTAELSDDADTNWFTANAALYIIDRATADGFKIDWDEGRAKFWDGEADKRFRKVLNKDKYEWLATTDTLALNTGARGPYGRN